MTKALVDAYCLLGMWGKEGTDPGMYAIANELAAVPGIYTHHSPYPDWDFRDIIDDIHLTHDTGNRKLVILGASLGANNGPVLAGYLKGKIVALLVGFQPSQYGFHSSVPGNVKIAICIWNPTWFITLGLGNYEWVLGPDNQGAEITISKDNGKTWEVYKRGTNGNEVRIIENSDVHPGDFNNTVKAYVYKVIDEIRSPVMKEEPPPASGTELQPPPKVTPISNPAPLPPIPPHKLTKAEIDVGAKALDDFVHEIKGFMANFVQWATYEQGSELILSTFDATGNADHSGLALYQIIVNNGYGSQVTQDQCNAGAQRVLKACKRI